MKRKITHLLCLLQLLFKTGDNLAERAGEGALGHQGRLKGLRELEGELLRGLLHVSSPLLELLANSLGHLVLLLNLLEGGQELCQGSLE